MQRACYKKASAYGSRVGWTPARRIHTYMCTWWVSPSSSSVVNCWLLMVLQLAVVRLLLQACARDGLSSDVSELIDGVCRQCDGWMAYKIGRQAARFSHHALASAIFARLTLAVSTQLRVSHPSSRHRLSYDECMEDKRKEYQSCLFCVVHSDLHIRMSSS